MVTIAGRDHLRVCGADVQAVTDTEKAAGSPPRVRSRPPCCPSATTTSRITSACAEQTGRRWRPSAGSSDHLRVCGADSPSSHLAMVMRGSPPRVRSRQPVCSAKGYATRITSACAEQKTATDAYTLASGDHLRVCGADQFGRDWNNDVVGSPPRVRSRRLDFQIRHHRLRITSACAEQTYIPTRTRRSEGDHLRVCGADQLIAGEGERVPGSPPRVRSRRITATRRRTRSRITSACAEQTPTRTSSSRG